MRRIFAVAALWLTLSASGFAADSRWIHIQSSDFDIYSHAGEGDTRRVLQYFERVRSFFQESLGAGTKIQTEPVHVIVFANPKDYEPYRPNSFATAFYTQIAGRDYIVLGGVADDVFPTAVHEYVHLVAQHGGLNLPPWLNEGVAEVFSTLKPLANSVVIGNVIPGRMFEISQQKWVPLATIVAADRNSPYYNEKNKAGSLYNEGWAFTHMLELSPAYAPRFGQLLAAMQKGTPSQQAIESIYGKPMAAMDQEVQAYLRQSSFTGRVYQLKLAEGPKAPSQPAGDFDVRLALIDLSNRRGQEAETRAKLEALAKDYPQRPEPPAGLGYLAWRAGDSNAARKSFGDAVSLGSQNPQLLWDYGRLAAGADPTASITTLNKLLALQPARTDVRLTLGQIELSHKQPGAALQTLSAISTVTKADAPQLFQLLAYAKLQLNDSKGARVQALLWAQNAKDDDDRDRAKKFVQFLDAAEARGARPGLTVEQSAEPGDGPPLLAHRDTPAPPNSEDGEPEIHKVPKRKSFTGKFVELNCDAANPKLILATDQGAVALLLDDPKNIAIRGAGSDKTVDLNCGTQKPTVNVRVEYEPADASAKGIQGLVRAIIFESDPRKP